MAEIECPGWLTPLGPTWWIRVAENRTCFSEGISRCHGQENEKRPRREALACSPHAVGLPRAPGSQLRAHRPAGRELLGGQPRAPGREQVSRLLQPVLSRTLKRERAGPDDGERSQQHPSLLAPRPRPPAGGERKRVGASGSWSDLRQRREFLVDAFEAQPSSGIVQQASRAGLHGETRCKKVGCACTRKAGRGGGRVLSLCWAQGAARPTTSLRAGSGSEERQVHRT